MSRPLGPGSDCCFFGEGIRPDSLSFTSPLKAASVYVGSPYQRCTCRWRASALLLSRSTTMALAFYQALAKQTRKCSTIISTFERCCKRATSPSPSVSSGLLRSTSLAEFPLLRQLEGEFVGGVVLQDIKDETLFNGLTHRVDVEGFRELSPMLVRGSAFCRTVPGFSLGVAVKAT